MKELSIEEKAKRYDEALKEAVVAHKDEDRHLKATLERIFSELAESEDERMVKFIKNQLFNIKKTITDNYKLDTELTKAIDWLEKQGNLIKYYEDKLDRCACDNFNKGYKKALEKQGEQKSAWTPMDEQRVENLLAIIEGHGYPGEVAWLNSLKDRVQSKQGEQRPVWSKDDESNLDSAIYYIRREPYLERNVEPIVNWLRTLKDRVQPKQE